MAYIKGSGGGGGGGGTTPAPPGPWVGTVGAGAGAGGMGMVGRGRRGGLDARRRSWSYRSHSRARKSGEVVVHDEILSYS